MENLTSVLIAIQARSNSQRLPNKCFEPIGSRRLLEHVVENCIRAASYSNKFVNKRNYVVDVAVLIPEGDLIRKGFRSYNFIEGPELDVLTRFKLAQEKYDADYVVRITGDCPLIPPFVISKHISLALMGDYDYISNVDEECRLSLDGIDCEVMTKRMLQWLIDNSKSEAEREHVTLRARTNPPAWAKRGFTASYFDFSGLKLSVDTPEDLERVRNEYERVGRKLKIAERIYGRDSVHRF